MRSDGDNQGKNAFCVVVISYLLNFLFLKQSASNDSGSGNNTTLIMGVVVAACVLIALVAVVALVVKYRSAKKKRIPNPTLSKQQAAFEVRAKFGIYLCLCLINTSYAVLESYILWKHVR